MLQQETLNIILGFFIEQVESMETEPPQENDNSSQEQVNGADANNATATEGNDVAMSQVSHRMVGYT